MTWMTFTIYVVIGYIVYYTLNILFDLLKKPAAVAGEIERLTVSDGVETIEVDDSEDDDIFITPNNSEEESNKKNNSDNNQKKEVKNQSTVTEDQIIPSTVEAEISKTGGVSITNLAKLYREQSIRESNKLPFAS